MAGLQNQHEFSVAVEDPESVWPALVNVYHEQGYESGYARGVSETLATALEIVEEFLSARGKTNTDNRKLLYDFSDFLDQRIERAPARPDHLFIDGLGI
jgi:hypothetical protein